MNTDDAQVRDLADYDEEDDLPEVTSEEPAK